MMHFLVSVLELTHASFICGQLVWLKRESQIRWTLLSLTYLRIVPFMSSIKV